MNRYYTPESWRQVWPILFAALLILGAMLVFPGCQASAEPKPPQYRAHQMEWHMIGAHDERGENDGVVCYSHNQRGISYLLKSDVESQR